MRDILREQGAVTVTCEFCHRPYRFDTIDIEALFTEDPAAGDTTARPLTFVSLVKQYGPNPAPSLGAKIAWFP